jgi:hypothetical protein
MGAADSAHAQFTPVEAFAVGFAGSSEFITGRNRKQKRQKVTNLLEEYTPMKIDS